MTARFVNASKSRKMTWAAIKTEQITACHLTHGQSLTSRYIDTVLMVWAENFIFLITTCLPVISNMEHFRSLTQGYSPCDTLSADLPDYPSITYVQWAWSQEQWVVNQYGFWALVSWVPTWLQWDVLVGLAPRIGVGVGVCFLFVPFIQCKIVVHHVIHVLDRLSACDKMYDCPVVEKIKARTPRLSVNLPLLHYTKTHAQPRLWNTSLNGIEKIHLRSVTH